MFSVLGIYNFGYNIDIGDSDSQCLEYLVYITLTRIPMAIPHQFLTKSGNGTLLGVLTLQGVTYCLMVTVCIYYLA